MKRLLFLSLSMLVLMSLRAQERQILYPHLSPTQTTETIIGGTVTVQMVYSRPSMRGRSIFGGLEPYGKIWRTGANKNTKIIFQDKVMVGDHALEAGTYTLFTKPNIDHWDIYFHTELDEYGAPEVLEEKNIKVHITVPVIALPQPYETLSIDFNDFTANSANLRIAWASTAVDIPISIPTEEILSKRLTKERTILADDYSMAAFILSEKENKQAQALQAINQSIALTENGQSFEAWLKTADLTDRYLPYRYKLKSEILAKLGRTQEAIQCAKRSLQIGRTVKDGFYIQGNLDNLEQWR
ncbi:MAG: DUF2911 domain-containing protein [Bacteroidota bacterium]